MGRVCLEPECLGQPWPEEAARPLTREEIGECWVCAEQGSWRRESSLRKEHRRKRLGKFSVHAEERARKGACPCRWLCEMWEKGLGFRDGGTGRSRKTQLGEVEN